MRVLTNIVAAIAFSALLTGCGGWHLRGSGEGSAVGYKVFVKDVNARIVGAALRRELVNRGAELVANRSSADVVMEIIGQRYNRRILSVDPSSGKVREIELGLMTDFQVRGGEGNLLIPRESVNWQLDYIFDENSLLGTTESDSIVQRDLADVAATAMVLRMQSARRTAALQPTE